MERVARGIQRQKRSRVGVRAEPHTTEKHLALAQGVGVQGPASWPSLFLAQSSLAEAAVCESV